MSTGALLDCGVAGRAFPGERESGDLHAIVAFTGGILVAVIDGLGHGTEAALAARTAADVLRQHPDEPPATLITRAHAELRRTRGVVLSLASFSLVSATMTWAGVGNVEGILLRSDRDVRPAHEALLVRGGVVGYQLPPLRTSTLAVRAGDTLIFATDGIEGGFASAAAAHPDPQVVAGDILRRFSKSTDDALVVVARYRGAG